MAALVLFVFLENLRGREIRRGRKKEKERF